MNEPYYLMEDGEKTGPFSYSELIERGIEINTPVLTSQSDEWQNASYIPEFLTYFESVGYHFPTEGNLAGFGWRGLAFLIDYILISIIVVVIEIQTGWMKMPTGATMDAATAYNALSDKAKMILELNLVVVFMAYNTLFEAFGSGGIGKKICRLKVVNEDGMKPTFITALVRNFGALLSLVLWAIPFLSIFLSDRSQTWYDRLAKAYTIRTD